MSKANRRRSKARRRGEDKRPPRPPLIRRLWTLVVNHPKGLLVAGATLLGLIVVFQNWRPTPAFFLVTDVSLPFIVWALIFMVVGYATGKWLEWGWRQRKIRKGTYRPRLSAEDLAPPESGAPNEAPASAASAPHGTTRDEDSPLSRSSTAKEEDGHESLPPVESVDYWSDAAGDEMSREPRAPKGVPEEHVHRSPGVAWSPAARQAAREAELGRLRRGGRPAGRVAQRRGRPAEPRPPTGPDGQGRAASGRSGGYGDYRDYGDAGRYRDYGDAESAGRYRDYGDPGGEGSYRDAGHYGDYGDTGHYGDYGDTGQYGDYADYGDGGTGSRRQARGSGPRGSGPART